MLKISIFTGIHGWGLFNGYLKGGIYLASTIRNSCKLWDCQVIPDEEEGRDIIGKFGDIEHLRKYIGPGEVMEENMMYWITDLTPHESLPLETRTYRQWFRLVTSRVSLWFQDHSTPNPLGIVPDPKITKIVKGSKFDEASLHIVSTDKDLEQIKEDRVETKDAVKDDMKDASIKVNECEMEEMTDSAQWSELPVEDENDKGENQKQWNPVFRAIFEGVYDKTSPLANLRGLPHVVQMILKHLENYWKSHIQLGQEGEVREYEPTEGQFVVKFDDQIKYGKSYWGLESDTESDTSNSSIRNDRYTFDIQGQYLLSSTLFSKVC